MMSLREYLNSILGKDIEVCVYSFNNYLLCNGLPFEINLILAGIIKNSTIKTINVGETLDITINLDVSHH